MTAYLTYSPEAIASIISHIKRLGMADTGTHFAGIWGASGSGKSTLAKELTRLLPDATIIPIDAYLSPHLGSATFNHTSPDPAVPYIEGLDPIIWDLELLNDHLEKLNRQQAIEMPVFDHKARQRRGYARISPTQTIIIEGAYALDNTISPQHSMTIVLDCPFHDRFIRKLVRTARITQRHDIFESIERYISKTEPSTDYYFRKYSSTADYVLATTSNPGKEFREFIGTDSFTPEPESFSLVPRPSSGNLHTGESLYLTPLVPTDTWHFTYCIDNRVVFDTVLPEEAIELLALHYHLNKLRHGPLGARG